MDQVYTQLTSRIYKLLNEIPYNQRLIISISGAPGSGKTAVAQRVAAKVNKIAHRRGFVEYNQDLAVVIPQEGFRTKRPDLEKLSQNNKQLVMLRDVPKLYNSYYLLNLLRFLHQEIHELKTPTVYAPTYDVHLDAIRENAIKLTTSARVIIIEGSYVQLKDPIWNDIASTVEERWFIRVKTAIGKRRLVARYFQNKVVQNMDEAEKMWEDVDMVKREYIITHTLMPDLIIDSIECEEGRY